MGFGLSWWVNSEMGTWLGIIFEDLRNVFLGMDKEEGYQAAVAEARAGADQGGVPIGACLVSRDGKILGRGHNMRVQKGSAILHVGLNNAHNAHCCL